jgi:hypothetical protein
MLGLKDFSDKDSYGYKVCDISSCENEASEVFESEERIIDVCYDHDKMLNSNKLTLW